MVFSSFFRWIFFIFPLFLFFSLFLGCKKKQKLDEYGGYYDASADLYRYENLGRQTLKDVAQGLEKPQTGRYQKIFTKVDFVVDNLVWISLKERPVYTLLTQEIKKEFKNEKNSQVAVWLEGISVRAFAMKDMEQKKRLLAQIAKTVNQVVQKKELWVTFELAPFGLGFRGFVFLPKSEGGKLNESLNYWMVSQGFSPYLLPQKKEALQPFMVEAEKKAKADKAGFWGLGSSLE